MFLCQVVKKAQIYAQNASEYVWRAGSAWTRTLSRNEWPISKGAGKGSGGREKRGRLVLTGPPVV